MSINSAELIFENKIKHNAKQYEHVFNFRVIMLKANTNQWMKMPPKHSY